MPVTFGSRRSRNAATQRGPSGPNDRRGQMELVRRLMLGAGFVGALGLAAGAAQAAPKIVSGPGYDPECFAPWSDKTKFMQWEAKPGPYRIALVNGFVGNLWRIQMVQTAKAFAETPGIKEKIKEFKVI